jgi:hypothetical protein
MTSGGGKEDVQRGRGGRCVRIGTCLNVHTYAGENRSKRQMKEKKEI